MGITTIHDPVRVNRNMVLFQTGFITRQAIDRNMIFKRRMQAGNFPAAVFDKGFRQRGAVMKIIRVDGVNILILTFHFADNHYRYAIRVQRGEKGFICG